MVRPILHWPRAGRPRSAGAAAQAPRDGGAGGALLLARLAARGTVGREQLPAATEAAGAGAVVAAVAHGVEDGTAGPAQDEAGQRDREHAAQAEHAVAQSRLGLRGL